MPASFNRAMTRNSTDTVATATKATQLWSDSNHNMTLNAEMTEIINIPLKYCLSFENPVLVNNIGSMPKRCGKFLGILLDVHLTFSKNVKHIISEFGKRISLLRQNRKNLE